MFGFSDDIPFGALKGKAVEWVAFSFNAVSFTLDDENRILIYSRREFYNRNSNVINCDADIIRMIGSVIREIEIVNGALAVFHFDNNSLLFKDEMNDFENYAFYIKNVEFIV